MFSFALDVLEFIVENTKSEQEAEALSLLDSLQSFYFVFSLHLMRNIIGVASFERKDEDIVNAMTLVKTVAIYEG